MKQCCKQSACWIIDQRLDLLPPPLSMTESVVCVQQFLYLTVWYSRLSSSQRLTRCATWLSTFLEAFVCLYYRPAQMLAVSVCKQHISPNLCIQNGSYRIHSTCSLPDFSIQRRRWCCWSRARVCMSAFVRVKTWLNVWMETSGLFPVFRNKPKHCVFQTLTKCFMCLNLHRAYAPWCDKRKLFYMICSFVLLCQLLLLWLQTVVLQSPA